MRKKIPLKKFSQNCKLISIAFLLFQFNLFSQSTIEAEYNFRNYTVESGLPSSETYDIEQDNEGNIWFGTDRGAVKYDGRKFVTFTKKDGLIDDVILQIYKDPFGKIWFLTLQDKLCYYENGKIKQYRFNHKIVTNFHNIGSLNPDKEIVINKDNTLILSKRANGYVIINKKGTVRKIFSNKNKLFVKAYDDKIIWSTSGSKKEIGQPYEIKFSPKNIKKQLLISKIIISDFKIVTTGNNENPFLLTENVVFNLKNKSKILEIQNSTLILIKKIENELWVGSIKNGINLYHLKKGKPIFDRCILSNYSVTDVFRDQNKGYWFTTLEAGIFYVPYLSIQGYTKKTGLISNEIRSINGLDNQIYVGYLGASYQKIINKKFYNFLQEGMAYSTFGKIGNKIIISNTAGVFFNGKKCTINSWIRDFYNGEKYCLAARDLIYKIYPNDKFEELTKIEDYDNNTNYAVMQDNKGIIWVGNAIGLFKCKNQTLIPYHHSIFSHRITDLIYSKKWGKVASTRDAGLFQFNNQNFKKIKGILTDDVACLFLDKKENLWVGTNKGVNILSMNNKGGIGIDCITKNHGLYSNEISSIFVNNKFAWIGTKKGLTKIDITNFHPIKENHKIELKSITLNNNKRLDLTKLLIIPYYEDIVKIKFGTIDFITKGKYRYRLHSFSNWTLIKDPEITLLNPEDGIYNLEVSFLDENNRWSTNQKIANFEIEPPFWRKIYFKIFLILIICFFLFTFIRFKKRQFETKQKLLMLEQKALFAQMNPHFIFNTLNSIQSFLIYNENEKAEYFLSKFSKLLRETLHISRNTSVSLSKEIEMLEKYLELEQMRFSNKFNWKFIFNTPENNLNIRIPNMLIQPYIENSIKHGFTEKRNDFTIEIILTLIDETTLKCEVIDNGIGRQASLMKKEQEISSKQHISYGEKITRERLKTYNKIKSNNFGANIFDIEIDGVSKGTKVEIIIPIIKK